MLDISSTTQILSSLDYIHSPICFFQDYKTYFGTRLLEVEGLSVCKQGTQALIYQAGMGSFCIHLEFVPCSTFTILAVTLNFIPRPQKKNTSGREASQDRSSPVFLSCTSGAALSELLTGIQSYAKQSIIAIKLHNNEAIKRNK